VSANRYTIKKIIKPEDFPVEMNEENLEILAKMSLIRPPSLDYNRLLPLLSHGEKILLYNKARQIRIAAEEQRWNALSPEEQAEEKRKAEDVDDDPKAFRGNLLQQELDSMALEEMERKKKNNTKE
jgi:hypothetical protein